MIESCECYFRMEPGENPKFFTAEEHQVVFQSSLRFALCWEFGCIRTARKILQALLREQITDDGSLSTLMCEVESIMNSRPITVVSSDPNDLIGAFDAKPLAVAQIRSSSTTWFLQERRFIIASLLEAFTIPCGYFLEEVE